MSSIIQNRLKSICFIILASVALSSEVMAEEICIPIPFLSTAECVVEVPLPPDLPVLPPGFVYRLNKIVRI